MKYDDATWHSGGEFPAELPPEAGATHAGLFLAWALLADLGSDYHVLESAEDLERLRARKLTPGQYFLAVCDGKLTDEDFDAEGNDFVRAYYQQDGASFIADYQEYLAKGLPSEYHVADTWTSYEKLKPVLDRRLANWRRGRPAPVRSTEELPGDILGRVTADFGSDETPRVLARLAGLIGQIADTQGRAPDARVLRCIVHLAAGDRAQLENVCRQALSDTRDVMYRAEYDANDRRIRDFDRPFPQES